MKSLWRSRKFRTVMVDLGVSLVLYFSARFLAPDIVGDIKFLIGVLQPVFGIIVAGIAYEDGQLKRAGGQYSGE